MTSFPSHTTPTFVKKNLKLWNDADAFFLIGPALVMLLGGQLLK